MAPRRNPDWVALSSPGPKRPLVPRVEAEARKIRAQVRRIEAEVDLSFEALYEPIRAGLGFQLSEDDLPRRSAWAVVAEWMVAASVGAPCAAKGLAAAHEWFWKDSDRPLGRVPALGFELGINSSVELRALLPYLLDDMSAATRREVLQAQSSELERSARKAAGVYYTPGDVAQLMVTQLQSNHRDKGEIHRWFDPACGSGVFLRAVLCALGGGPAAAEKIYGVDLEPIAAEMASFVLTAEDLAIHPGRDAPWERWHRFRNNLATGDALLIDPSTQGKEAGVSSDRSKGHHLGNMSPWQINAVFPEIADRGFDRIIANPPYARLRQNQASRHIPDLHPITGSSASQDISPVFVELSANLLSSNGALAIVLPLSVVTSMRAPFPALRQYLADQPGRLELRSFDRAPDALFGDDIKTRNSVVHLDRTGEDRLLAGPLVRWTSRNRHHVLANTRVVPIGDLPDVPRTIPKIGSEWERKLLLACRGQPRFLADGLVGRRMCPLDDSISGAHEDGRDLVALAPTAYNFLGVVRSPGHAVADGHDSQNSYFLLSHESGRLASMTYAVLCSRLAFWLWHVTADGFHVTTALQQYVPIPQKDADLSERLASLGDQLWETVGQMPQASKNRGRTTVAYPTGVHTELIDEIDFELEKLIGLRYLTRLAAWYEGLIVVDSDSERRKKIGRKIKQ